MHIICLQETGIFLYGFKLVPLNQRISLARNTNYGPLSLTLSCFLPGRIFRVMPMVGFLREFSRTGLRRLGRGALLLPCVCGYFTFLTKENLQQGSHFFAYKQFDMSHGSGTRLVDYFLIIGILLCKLSFAKNTMCQGLLSFWKNGMESGPWKNVRTWYSLIQRSFDEVQWLHQALTLDYFVFSF